MSEQQANNKQVNVLFNIWENIKRGVEMGKRIISLQGSSRSGKTYNTMIWLIVEALKEPTHISVVRKSLPALKRSVLQDFKEIMIAMGQWNDKNFNKTDLIYSFPNHSVMEFFSADDEQKIRGSKRAILFCNEANELEHSEFNQLFMRTTKYTIIDYNPSFTEEHWIFPLRSQKNTYHFVSTFRDNIFLEDAVKEAIESYKDTNPALWQIYGMGEFAIIDGLVFPKENWDIIPDTDFPDWADDGFVGLDWGWEPDPTVAEHVIVEGNDVYVKELFRDNKLFATDIAEKLENYRGCTKYCDIDKRLVADLENAGIPLLNMTEKSGTTILTGIHLLNQRKIHITESSTELIKEFRNYVYKKDRNGTVMTDVNPVGKFDHGVDALRYVMLAEFGSTTSNKTSDKDYALYPDDEKYDLGFVI